MTGIGQIEPSEESVANRTSSNATTASATLKGVLLSVITRSMGFMVSSPDHIIDCGTQLIVPWSSMHASREDIRAMVTALFVTNAALDRARRQKKGANTLSLLQVIAATPGLRPSEIAIAQDVHPSQATRQVRELESMGLVQVDADPADKRSCRVTLTTAGADELLALTEVGLDRFASFVEEWEADEVKTFTGLLQKFEASKAAVAEKHRPPTGRRWALAST
jgi:DNA-binding MarR family transcriptional regulator